MQAVMRGKLSRKEAAEAAELQRQQVESAVKMQAVMRAHRIGQTRPVIATRFCTADTIEERMFDLQKKKALVFEGCMDGNQASLAQLTEEDLQFLFKR